MTDRFSRAFLVFFVLLWSTGFIGARLGLPHAEPMTFLLIRYVIVIGCMALIAVATGARWPARHSAEWRSLAWRLPSRAFIWRGGSKPFGAAHRS